MNKSLASAIVNGLLIGVAVLSLAPLLWMLSVSLMTPGEASQFPPPLLPAHATLANYRELFAHVGMGRYFFNSALLATSVTLLSLASTWLRVMHSPSCASPAANGFSAHCWRRW